MATQVGGPKDWVMPVALIGGGSLLLYGLYTWAKKTAPPPPADHHFTEVEISVSPNPAMAGATVTVSGSFKYSGPGGSFRILSHIAHAPFGQLYEDEGAIDRSLSATGGKTFNFSIPVRLDWASAVASPFDVEIRFYDDVKKVTVGAVVFTGELVIEEAIYQTDYSVSPSGAGFYIVGGTYGTESGTISEGTHWTWLNIEVVARAGYVFDHWEGVEEDGSPADFIYSVNVNSNSVYNRDGTSIKAVFVPSSQKANWVFKVENPDGVSVGVGYIDIYINGVETASVGNNGIEGFSFDRGENVMLYALGYNRNSLWPWEPEYWLLDHWELDGVAYNNTSPISFYISDVIGHTLKAIMK